MTATYYLGRLDFLRLNLFSFRRHWKGWLLFGSGFGFFLVWQRWNNGRLVSPLEIVTALIVWLLVSLLVSAAWLLYMLLLAFLRASKTSGVVGFRRLELSPTGLRHEIDLVKADLPWAAVKSIHRTRRYLFFELQGRGYFQPPRRAFASDADYLAFGDYAEQQLRLFRAA